MKTYLEESKMMWDVYQQDDLQWGKGIMDITTPVTVAMDGVRDGEGMMSMTVAVYRSQYTKIWHI
jgi:hypothetical protein